MATEYHVYANTGAGDPINYSSPIATVSSLTWTSSGLSHPGTWSFGVRAFDTVSGLEEQNLDCALTCVLNSSGQDITSQPVAPSGLRAFALAGGSVRIEWMYVVVSGSNAPTGFHVYIGTGATVNYSSAAATVLFDSGIANAFATNLTGLTGGIAYTIGVRAYNAVAEESNTNTVTVTADAAGPVAVVSLTATSTS